MRLWLLLPFASSAGAPERCEVFDDEEGLRLLQHQAAALPTGPCSAGQGRPAPGAPCLPCTEGTWSSTGSCLSCVAGTWSDLRGATSAESCQHCPEGTWSSQVGATALQAREGTAWSVQIMSWCWGNNTLEFRDLLLVGHTCLATLVCLETTGRPPIWVAAGVVLAVLAGGDLPTSCIQVM